MSEYIEREKAQEGLDNIDWYHVNDKGQLLPGGKSDIETYVPFKAVEEMLKSVPAADAIEERCQQVDKFAEEAARLYAKQPKWIPVTEQLPEEHVFVLIRQDDDRMMVAERVDGAWWYRYFAYDVDRWDENEQGTITHWMPLPQPPKEET